MGLCSWICCYCIIGEFNSIAIRKKITSRLLDCGAGAGHNGSYGFPLWGKLSPQVTDEGAGKQLLPGNHPSSGATRHLPPRGEGFMLFQEDNRMMDATKYAPGYYPVPAGYDSWVKKDHIEKAPAWCSVDLRDGNQALIVPMSLAEKLEFFQMLVKIGFKEIEVGFPAASETEYEFLRTLIEKNMIPADVTVQVLTQCRDHIIRRTFEAVKGAPRAVIHFYNSTSVAQREQVFHKSKEEIKQIAVDGAKLVKQLSEEYEGNFLFEYSPESFTGTEVDYAVEVCNAVLDIMQPTPDRPMIINLPVTVEMSMPHVYANQIEYCDKHLKLSLIHI